MPSIYRELVDWYPLLDPTADHREEAGIYADLLTRGCPGATTLLELGAGAGNNAWFLKERFRCTLTDISPEMLGLSRAQNPDCEHLTGDMRTLRLGRAFDAVLVHDAVTYMLTPDDLAAVAATAFVHTRPGGAALFAPDCTRESFEEGTTTAGNAAGGRALQYLEWSWDPDPIDTTYRTEYTFLLREAGAVRAVHETHEGGLFSKDEWRDTLQQAGFEVEVIHFVLTDFEFEGDIFLCTRP